MALIAIVLIFAGLAFFALGRRGRAVGHHPFCRLCGFNLHALPLDHQRCPECGANILLPDAIHVGDRRPLYSVMILGAVLGFAGGILIAPPVLDAWTSFDATPYTPFAWLQSDIHSPGETQRTRACRELLRRIQSGSVAAADVDRLAEGLLKLQVDTTMAWQPIWGDLIQAGHKARKLSSTLWQRYLTQTMQITAHARPRVRMDDPIPIALTCQFRGGTDFIALVPATVVPRITATLGTLSGPVRARSVPLDSVPIPIEWSALWIPTREGASATNWPADTHALPPGPQTIDLTVAMSLTDAEGTSVSAAKSLALPLQVLARDKSSVELLQTPAMQPDMLQAIRLRRPASFSGAPADPLPITAAGGSLGSLWVAGPPMGAAFRVVLRQGTHDWSLARFLVRPNDAVNIPLTLEISPLDQGPGSGDAEIVCLPDPSLAIGTADVLEVWAGEIHIPLPLAVPQP